MEGAYLDKLDSGGGCGMPGRCCCPLVDDEGATTLAVMKLTLTSRQLARVGNLHDVGVRFGVLGEGNSLLSLLGILGLAIDDEGTSISSMR